MVLGVALPQQAQPCVLYGQTTLPRDPLRLMLPALYSKPGSLAATGRCLRDMDRSRELVVTLIDTVFALTYGGGLVLLLRTLARHAAGGSFAAILWRCGAVCFAVAAAFDLMENQITAALLSPLDGPTRNVLVTAARICAMPKYVLALVIGPALAALGGVLVAIRRLWRQRRNDDGRA